MACLIENNLIIKSNKLKGFVLPYKVAPYKVQIIYSEENKEKATNLYTQLLENEIPTIIDDRENLTIGNKVNDVFVLGTPKMIILGNKFDGKNYELEDSLTETKKSLTLEEIISELKAH